jgi:hypothetical protein
VGGYLMSTWLDPLKPSRANHLIGALACLGATAVAMLASVLSQMDLLLAILRR